MGAFVHGRSRWAHHTGIRDTIPYSKRLTHGKSRHSQDKGRHTQGPVGFAGGGSAGKGEGMKNKNGISFLDAVRCRRPRQYKTKKRWHLPEIFIRGDELMIEFDFECSAELYGKLSKLAEKMGVSVEALTEEAIKRAVESENLLTSAR